jgi:hypothetical protein
MGSYTLGDWPEVKSVINSIKAAKTSSNIKMMKMFIEDLNELPKLKLKVKSLVGIK